MRLASGFVVVAALSLWGAGLAQAEEDGATGIWRMENGKVTVKLAPCGSALCGTVVALKKPLDDEGRPKLDKENPVKSLRGRPVIGLTILSNMQPSGDGRWSGTIYNPDDGYTYRSRMKLQDDVMRVDGCVTIFCKTMKFIRVK